MEISSTVLGKSKGREINEYRLRNRQGMEVVFLNFGCAITAIYTPDRDGKYENIVLGYHDFREYEENNANFGVVVGRVAGRIRGAGFNLNGKYYTLAENDGANHLHGGYYGFQRQIWTGKMWQEEQAAGVNFSYVSPDGEENYPGTLDMTVSYTLTDSNELLISYQGKLLEEDQKQKTKTMLATLLNPTNHTYFNLSGNCREDISQHWLQLDSSRFLQLTADLLPTGQVCQVENTMFDFRQGRQLKDGICSEDPQNLLAGKGYDHPFCLDGSSQTAIKLWEEKSGRQLTITTDAPAVVLYTGNQLQKNVSVYGQPARKYLGVCLETQGLPDAIHHAHFPSCVLKTGEEFYSETKYSFNVLS